MTLSERLRPDLREFQEEDLPWFLEHPKSFMLYEPRLGKTVMSSNVIMLDPECKVILVCCSKNALFTWRDHLLVWNKLLCPETTLDVRMVRAIGQAGAKKQREAIWLKPRTAEKTVFICTFGVLQQDFLFLQRELVKPSGLHFDTVIGDEVHLRMKNRKTKTNKIFKTLTTAKHCKRWHPLSGTMTSKGGPLDFWPILNMFNPKRFGSYWAFANTFTEWIDGHWGREIIGPKNLVTFWKLMSEYSRIRTRKKCAPQMPKVQRQMLRAEPTTEQLNLVYKLKEEGFVWSNTGDMTIAANSLELNLRFRQILTCPKILSESYGVGAALEDLVQQLEDPEISVTPLDKQIVIFSSFKKAFPHFRKYLEDCGYKVFELSGGIEPEEQEEQIKLWRESQGIMLCTTKYAQAFSLTPAEKCFHIGYEWDPNDNKQAEDRLVGQSGGGHIDSYYYSLVGLDEQFADSLNTKHKLITLTLGTTENVQLGRDSKKSLGL